MNFRKNICCLAASLACLVVFSFAFVSCSAVVAEDSKITEAEYTAFGQQLEKQYGAEPFKVFHLGVKMERIIERVRQADTRKQIPEPFYNALKGLDLVKLVENVPMVAPIKNATIVYAGNKTDTKGITRIVLRIVLPEGGGRCVLDG